ncbi:type IX secretion system protein PorG [Thermophagus sp. OGC60D27]|uniref:type IX secretion system protein PorG n=1 Tax=Thermophagus sp. OGC60D27 TaxID=3458415 RepID=UPI0040376293
MLLFYRICCIVLMVALFLHPSGSLGQDRIEGGFFLGASYYYGDLNPGQLFYRAQPSLGGVIRVVANSRIAFKGGLTVINLKGNYPDQNVRYPLQDGYTSSQYRFKRSMADFAAQIEINFFQYDHPFRSEETRFSPYISTGMASTLYRRYNSGDEDNSEKPHFILSLPIGIGIKWKLSDWVHVGVEWNFRKTFADDLDLMGHGAIDPSDPYGFNQSSFMHNNDWYSFAGLLVTFDLYHRRVTCNAGY